MLVIGFLYCAGLVIVYCIMRELMPKIPTPSKQDITQLIKSIKHYQKQNLRMERDIRKPSLN